MKRFWPRRGDSKAGIELGYWRWRLEEEGGTLEHRHYEHFYTEWWGLDRAFYAGRRVLDIGCGPRGSLEWADMAARRVGLDPLADVYRRELGADAHAMEYLNGGAEAIDAPDDAFDIVTSITSLDHVDDIEASAREILRVLAPGGTFLIMTDANKPATTAEPQSFGAEVLDHFVPPLEVTARRDLERHESGIFASMLENEPFDSTRPDRRFLLTARLTA